MFWIELYAYDVTLFENQSIWKNATIGTGERVWRGRRGSQSQSSAQTRIRKIGSWVVTFRETFHWVSRPSEPFHVFRSLFRSFKSSWRTFLISRMSWNARTWDLGGGKQNLVLRTQVEWGGGEEGRTKTRIKENLLGIWRAIPICGRVYGCLLRNIRAA